MQAARRIFFTLYCTKHLCPWVYSRDLFPPPNKLLFFVFVQQNGQAGHRPTSHPETMTRCGLRLHCVTWLWMPLWN